MESDQQQAATVTEQPRKWTSTAGPIQTKKVNVALRDLNSQHAMQTRLSGVQGLPETESRSTYMVICGGLFREDVKAVSEKIAKQFDYIVTRENYQDIVKAITDALPALSAAIPVVDERITQEKDAENKKWHAERQARDEAQSRGRQLVQEKIKQARPSWAYALIVAVLHEDASESQSDYWAHKTTRTVAIGWRSGRKEDFRQLRAAAARYEPTKHLGPEADAKEVEHRENYSMGAGNYVKAGGRHSSGWCVESVDPSSGDGSYYVPHDLEFAFPEGQEAPQGASGEATGATGATVTLNAAKNGVEVRFPSKPDQSTIDQLKGHGFHWTFKGGGCWYHRQDERSIAFAHSLAGTTPPANGKLSGDEEGRLHELEEKNAKSLCGEAELNELQALLDRHYDQPAKQEERPDRFDMQVEDNMREACGA